MARTKKDKLVSSVSSEKMMDSLSTEGMIDSLKKVLLAKRTLILQGAPGTGKTFIAKKIAEKLLEKDSENECLKIVQFHPSYSYEDFVRGIIATTDEKSGNLVYTPKNKLFAEFAKDAYDNYCDSKKESLAVNKQNWVNKQWEEYKEALNQKQ